MSQYDFDLFVIGGGSGGVRAARIAAGYGATVGICESYRYGGTCVIRGCVPKKLLVYAAHFSDDFRDAAAYGWDLTVNGFDWQTLIANKDREIDRLNDVYISLLENAGVKIHHQRGRFLDPHTLQIGDETVSAAKILIAVGGAPVVPEIPGAELAITSDDAFHLRRLPPRVAIVGGGYIAVEFAGIFNGLGSDTHVLYRGEQILRGFDQDLRDHLAQQVSEKGVTVRTEINVAAIEKNGDALTALLTDGSRLDTDCVMFATGRAPQTDDLGLELAGVAVGSGGQIMVDERSRTNREHIFAVGDVTDRIALTPVALMEGHCFADSEFGDKPRLPDHDNVPSAIFAQPPAASVGLTEEAARERYGDVDVYKSRFRTLKDTLTGNADKTLMKLIVEVSSDRVVGVHMVGPDAAELMQGIAVAVKCGATKAQFDATVGIHPTAAEEFVTMREKSTD